MKRLAFSLFAVLTAWLSYAADVDLRFEFDNPQAIKKFSIDFKEIAPVLEVNDIKVDIPDGPGNDLFVLVELNDGYLFDGVTSTPGASQPYVGQAAMSMYVKASDNNAVWSVSTIDLAAARTGSLTLNVDNPAKVRLREVKTGQDIALTAGTNTVSFIPSEDASLRIIPASYYDPIFSVTLNGQPLTADSNREYAFTPAEGDVVDITADFPDRDFNVTFTYDEGAEKAIRSVSVDYVAVDFDGYSLSVKAGSEVCLRFDDDAFQLAGLTIDGVAQTNLSAYFYFTPMGDSHVHVSAHPYGDITASIIIDNPDNALVYKNYASYGDLIALTPGVNKVSMPEKSAKIAVWHSSNGKVTSITDGTNDYQPGQYSLIQLADGMELTITTESFVRDNRVVFWLDSRDGASSLTLSLGSYDFRTEYGPLLTDGYNELMIDPAVDNPATFTWYIPGVDCNAVYMNGSPLEPLYPGGKYYNLPPMADGDVIKAFIHSEPVVSQVSVDVAEGVDIEAFVDRVTRLAPVAGTFEAFDGTEVKILPATTATIEVLANGIPVAADDCGGFTVVVAGDTRISVSDPSLSGITTVAGGSAPATLYNLQGRRVDNPAKGVFIKVQDGKTVKVIM